MHISNPFPNAAHDDDTRRSFIYLMGLFCLAGLILFTLSDFQPQPEMRWRWLSCGLALQLSAVLAWFLEGYWPHISRYLATLLTMTVVLWGVQSTFATTFLSFLAIPALVAFALLGVGMAIGIALLETLWLASLFPSIEQLPALIALWLTITIVAMLIHPLRETTAWAWRHYALIRHRLDVERDYKADLAQALHELLQANRQLDLLNERLGAMRQLAEDATKTKTAFVAKVSHEFRTPLNMIIGLIDLVVQTPDLYGDALAPMLVEDLQIVQRNCHHLAGMIDDVLDLSQTEAGRLVLHHEWSDLTTAIEDAIDVVKPLLVKKNLAFHLDVEAALPPLYCDIKRIRQVILNLLSNAARYTEEGAITVDLRREDSDLVVRIRDTGPGIAAADLAHIFDPFYQAGDNPWHERKGNGLGLTISKQLIELHRGAIWVESAPGCGSTFAFRLPLQMPPPPTTQAGRWLHEDWLWHERVRPPHLPATPYEQRVILYDETGDLLTHLRHMEETIEILDMPDIDTALTTAQRCPPHALLINTAQSTTLMPLLHQAKAMVPDTPILGYNLRSTPLLTTADGILHYLTKPVTRADLKGVMTKVGRPIQQILIVDDDVEFRALLKRMVEALDETLVVTTAHNSRHAVRLLEEMPDLIFLDLSMPEIDGHQLLQLKNRDSHLRAIPVVIVSAQDPVHQPLSGDQVVAVFGQGMLPQHLLHCSLRLAAQFLQPA